MQANIYLFGDLGKGYTQYLDDYTRSIFKEFAKQLRSKTQLLFHREDNTIYYSYIRRLDNSQSSGKYIGMCYAISGCLIYDYEGLFRNFEGAITFLTSRGSILEFDKSGEISSNVDQLYKSKSEFAQISDYLQLQLESLDASKVKELPPLNYAINSTETKCFSVDSNIEEINSALGVYSYVYISKDENYDTESLRSYVSILKENKKQIDGLEQEKIELKSECNRLKRVQKRTTLVAALSIVLVFVALFGFRQSVKNNQLEGDLNATQVELEKTGGNLTKTQQTLHETNNAYLDSKKELASQRNDIDSLYGVIDKKDAEISSLITDKRKLSEQCDVQKDRVSQKEREIRNLNSQIDSLKKQKSVIRASDIKNDISLKLYNISKSQWLYTNSSVAWEVRPNALLEKNKQVKICIYYKDQIIAEKEMDVRFRLKAN